MLQGSEQWRLARCGSVGASDMPRAVRKIKSGGYSADRAALMAEKFVERLTGRPFERYRSRAMEQGSERQEEAKLTYELLTGLTVEDVAIVPHPKIEWTHASPDGLVGLDGLVEIKCPEPAAHIEMLESGIVPTDYLVQIGWQMACTGRRWCDFVSFNPDFPTALAHCRQRIIRSDRYVAELEEAARAFTRELDEKLLRFSRRYGVEERRSAA